ncbi:hypothetical protein ABEL28_22945 [Escherichia coli]|uniref:hypothetical protein n=1 Tax=Escherichia coli TaxID=562 RepID=UPI00351D8434
MEQIDKRKQDKLKFDRVINLAHRLPQPAIHDLLGEHEKPRGSHRMMPSTGVKITTIIS